MVEILVFIFLICVTLVLGGIFKILGGINLTFRWRK